MFHEKIKMLEINFGKNAEATRFDLTDVGDDCFVLSEMEHVSLLSELLNKWIQKNITISSQDYQKMVNLRNGLICDLDEEIDAFFFESDVFLNAKKKAKNL